jgi:hypothetical protein
MSNELYRSYVEEVIFLSALALFLVLSAVMPA